MQPNDTGDIAEFCSCHITADRNINGEFFSSGACGGGAYLAMQTAALGEKYVVASYNDNPGLGALIAGYYAPSNAENAEGFFEIIAPYDSTKVTITPNSTTMRGHTGVHRGIDATGDPVPYTVTLKRGQCYFVKSWSDDNTVDISGSVVESNKPVVVLAGHENAFIGGPENPTKIDGRNFMIQQMIPEEDWDTTGYVSIPLKDSQPQDTLYEGAGENYRVYVYDSLASQVQCYDASLATPVSMQVARYNYPAREREHIINPVDFETMNGVKFSVMMYDRRYTAISPPFPAPSMMTIIPMSRWRTSFLWYVPANKFESFQGYYVNIIAPDSDFTGLNGILASFNGGTIKPIKQVLGLEQQWKNIPKHPGLTGVRFKLYPGSYYARGPHPFMVYNFGFRGLDPDNDLGDFDGDDFFFEYGLPVGYKIGRGTPHIGVTVDTFCTHWNICAHDTSFGLPGIGINSVTLIDDANGDFVKPGKMYYNTRLDDSLDPNNSRDINFTGNDSDACFKVLVNKPIDSAYAPVFIADDQGNAIILDLHYSPPLVKLTPDSGRYLLTSLGKDTCLRFVFYNKGNAGTKSFTFISDKLKANNPSFKVTSTTPSLPATIKPGDSLVITACFNAKDTMLQRDTIMLVNDCFFQPIDLAGSAGTPLIIADDHDFGALIVDSTKCATVGVKNVGNAPLILTTQWLMDNYGVNFTFPNAATILPMSLNPGQKVMLTFCYTPHGEHLDSTVMHWGTNLIAPYAHSIKDTSILIGFGVKAGFAWDRIRQTFVGDSTVTNDSVIARVYLFNNSTDIFHGPPVHIDRVLLTGPNVSEFYILNDKLGKVPLGNFDLAPGDSIWVDVVFKPELIKPYPQRHADRHADLVAQALPGVEKDQIVNLVGSWAKSGVAISSSQSVFTIHPNPASGNSVIVSFSSPQERNATLALYDVLGRQVYRRNILQGTELAEIPLRNLENSLYYVRLSSDGGVITEKLQVVR
jgi:hypothetical protein